jgi:ArsR family transcriptional regulator
MSKPFSVDTDLLKEAALQYRAINHSLRLQILEYLHQREGSSVMPIYTHLGLEQSVVSQQLAILRQAGLVKAERRRKEVHYTVNHETLTILHTAAEMVVAKMQHRRQYE